MITYNSDMINLIGKIGSIIAVLYLAYKTYKNKKPNYKTMLVFYGLTALFFLISIFKSCVELIIGYLIVLVIFISIIFKGEKK